MNVQETPMILELAVSSLRMGYPLHAINVLRHWDSSWLSREIIFEVGFAELRFLFALSEWFHVGSFKVRRALAVTMAIVGIGLVSSRGNYDEITSIRWRSALWRI